MTQKIEKFVIKDIGATSFKKLLTELGACYGGMEYTEGKTLKQFFNQTRNGNWIEWLILNASENASQILDEKLAKLASRFVNHDLSEKVNSEWRDAEFFKSHWSRLHITRLHTTAASNKYRREKSKHYRKYYKVV